MVTDHAQSQTAGQVVLALQLQHQALAQVAGGYAGRFQAFDHRQHPFHIAGLDHNSLFECDVVGNRASRATQVALTVNVADDVSGNHLVLLVHALLIELLHEHIHQALVADNHRFKALAAVDGAAVAALRNLALGPLVVALQVLAALLELSSLLVDVVETVVGVDHFFERRIVIQLFTDLILNF